MIFSWLAWFFMTAALAGCTTYYGAASIHSDPPGARVFDMEDGYYIGVTPLTHVWRSGDAPRKFMNIRLHKEGYSDELSTFWLNLDYSNSDRAWNSPQILDIKLKPAS